MRHRSVHFSAAVAASLILEQPVAAGDDRPHAPRIDSVTVTASRIIRDGYVAPTPTTVLDADFLLLRAPATLANALARLPQMRNAADDSTGSLIFGGAAGRGFVNLRGLGTNRTLVLFDGERLVSNSLSGERDISLLPSALISRVDVVTGGASASYGSDAIAGVVNFIVDSRLRGFKASIEGGLSEQGDAGMRKATAAWGGSFGERWSAIASAEIFDRSELSPDSRSFATPSAIVPNPSFTATNGQRPSRVVRNAYDADQALGGLILNGPLAGQQFLPDGTTAPYVPASCTVSQPYALCESRQRGLAATLDAVALTSPQRRVSAFGRLMVQITPQVDMQFDALLAHDQTSITSVPLETQLFDLQLPIDVAENPYLPEAVRDQYLSAGELTLFMGRQNRDEGKFEDLVRESVESFSARLRARLGGTWLLQAHASYGHADSGERWQNAYSIDRFLNAVDAVSVNGNLSCRINAIAVTDPACAPADIFGEGNMSAEAKAYFLGTIYKPLKTQQRSLALDVTGQPLSVPAGPVSIAVGASYREETTRQFTSDPEESFAFTGYPAFGGEARVTEAYAQTLIPLVRAIPFAKSLEADLAVRSVHYSQAGSELPWKLGLNWVAFQGLRFRLAASEDIRAPNVLELDLPQFNSSISPQVNPVPDGVPLFNSLGIAPGQSLNVRELDGGNPDLTSETAHTVSAGVVWQPTTLPGLMLSLDHFRIKVRDAITTLPASAIISNCATGNQNQCALIAQPADSTLPVVSTISVNAQSFSVSGLDGEANYKFRLAGGEATIRVLANYLAEYEQVVPGAAPLELRGDISSGLPALQGDLSMQFSRGGTTALLSGIYIGSGSYRKNLSAELQNNHVPHVWYVGATIEQRLGFLCTDCSAYAAVNNLFDQPPPHPGFGIYNNIESSFLTGVPYDRVGRYFKVGVRLAF